MDSNQPQIDIPNMPKVDDVRYGVAAMMVKGSRPLHFQVFSTSDSIGWTVNFTESNFPVQGHIYVCSMGPLRRVVENIDTEL
jgi:hypothetical protein